MRYTMWAFAISSLVLVAVSEILQPSAGELRRHGLGLDELGAGL